MVLLKYKLENHELFRADRMKKHNTKLLLGCLQWLYGTREDGSAYGLIESFNYKNGWHLANQNQNICIRREAGFCSICYSQVSICNNFMLCSSGLETK